MQIGYGQVILRGDRAGEITSVPSRYPSPSVRAFIRPVVSARGIDWKEEGKNPIGNSVHPSPSASVRPCPCVSDSPSLRPPSGLALARSLARRRSAWNAARTEADEKRRSPLAPTLSLSLLAPQPVSQPASGPFGSGEPRRLGPPKVFPRAAKSGSGWWLAVISFNRLGFIIRDPEECIKIMSRTMPSLKGLIKFKHSLLLPLLDTCYIPYDVCAREPLQSESFDLT